MKIVVRVGKNSLIDKLESIKKKFPMEEVIKNFMKVGTFVIIVVQWLGKNGKNGVIILDGGEENKKNRYIMNGIELIKGSEKWNIS